MVQFEHLQTASQYINNQLLARGLLKDGQTIAFDDPEHGSDGGTAETMGRIMSIVNDLILRRDRDSEQREALATALRSARAESDRQSTEVTRLVERLSGAERRLAGASTAEAGARAQLRVAETTIRQLREDVGRARANAAQTRANCAAEVRKRDRHIEALKKGVADAARTRGATRSANVSTIVVTGDFAPADRHYSPTPRAAGTVDDSAEYDLHAETNNFLADLAKSLGAENDALLGLVRRTISRLREMSGLSGAEDAQANDIKSNPHVSTFPVSCNELSGTLDSILEHLRAILSNPSFVPIEEVEERDEEIERLRVGWDKMEARWKEAVHLIDSWRQRMLSNGEAVDVVDQLKLGLHLSPLLVANVAETRNGVGNELSTVAEEECEEERAGQLENIEEEAVEQVKEEEQDEGRRDAEVLDSSDTRLETLSVGFHNEDEAASKDRLSLVPAPEYCPVDDILDSISNASSLFLDDAELEDIDAHGKNVEVLDQTTVDMGTVRHMPSQRSFIESALPEEDSDDSADYKDNNIDNEADDDNDGGDIGRCTVLQESVDASNRSRGGRSTRLPLSDFSVILEENTLDLAEAMKSPVRIAMTKSPIAFSAVVEDSLSTKKPSSVAQSPAPPSSGRLNVQPPSPPASNASSSGSSSTTNPAAQLLYAGVTNKRSRQQPKPQPTISKRSAVSAPTKRLEGTKNRPATSTITHATVKPQATKPSRTTSATRSRPLTVRPVSSHSSTATTTTKSTSTAMTGSRATTMTPASSLRTAVKKSDARSATPDASAGDSTTAITTVRTTSITSTGSSSRPQSRSGPTAVATAPRPSSARSRDGSCSPSRRDAVDTSLPGGGSRLPVAVQLGPSTPVAATAVVSSPVLSTAAIAAKLRAAQANADAAARVRAKLRAVRCGSGNNIAAADPDASKQGTTDEGKVTTAERQEVQMENYGQSSNEGFGHELERENENENEQKERHQQQSHDGEEWEKDSDQLLPLTVTKQRAGVDRDGQQQRRRRSSRAQRVANRRRSTLTPVELQCLISGSAHVE